MELFTGKTGEKGINNKVYVNPNFKRSMHVNPNFSHQFTNHYHSNKNKIFINPNFIRSPNPYKTEVNHSPFNVREKTLVAENIASDTSVRKPMDNISKNTSVQNPTVSRNQNVPLLGTSYSRYSFVRHKESANKAVVTQSSRQRTIKVNKYKSVSLTDAKTTLENTKLDFSKTSQTVAHKHEDLNTLKCLGPNVNTSARTYKSRYKIIIRNKNARNVPSVSVNTVYRKNNSITQLGQKHCKIKMNRKLLKKNNIPCPLFRKYGKCLRHIQGHCGFLHDKKHVTVCRLFIKGMCHNTECLLSHDLSLQKMPTCYFFLKGMCTKDKCPYLHVKLNEKAKICADFVKGYCEKGDSCMDRHVNMCLNFATKGSCSKKQCSHPNKRTEINNKKTKDLVLKQSRKPKNVKILKEKKTDSGRNTDKETVDCRYYKDTLDYENTSDVYNKIKPIRCKLGTLPSFIEL